MSDADWDTEYKKEAEIEQQIRNFCNTYKVPLPQISEYARSNELEEVLCRLKLINPICPDCDKVMGWKQDYTDGFDNGQYFCWSCNLKKKIK